MIICFFPPTRIIQLHFHFILLYSTVQHMKCARCSCNGCCHLASVFLAVFVVVY